MLRLALLVIVSFSTVQSDVFLHNPRGSSNRLNTAVRQIVTPNRLFDSKGNIRGGYNVGVDSMKYIPGSILPVEWTIDDSCNSDTTRCEVILQYMCADGVRDGSREGRLGGNCNSAQTCANRTEFGMHEDFTYYDRCSKRQRNKGLFTGNQTLRETATSTRQNPTAMPYGFECPEEKEYYPYWQPTLWRDIAILTDEVSRCDYYRQESENVKARSWCDMESNGPTSVAISEPACQHFGGTWRQSSSHGLPPPECYQAPFSNNNYFGNGLSRTAHVYNWTIPDAIHPSCVFRVRYNITPSEIRFDDDFRPNARLNQIERYGLSSQEEAEKRGFVLKATPEVDLFGDGKVKLALNLEPKTFGTTYEDRSHVFSITPRPRDVPQSARIYNVNVRGKRGNIVQVFPSVEYDFVPNTLELSSGDYVHFQWTGSDLNPANNDGQGRAGTDRSNVVLLREPAYVKGEFDKLTSLSRFGHWPRCYPAYLDHDSPFLNMSAEDRISLARSRNATNNQLDDASAYFDLGPRRITSTGISHYMCSRNNNFSNRDQKGRIIVHDRGMEYATFGYHGGSRSITASGGNIVIEGVPGSFEQATPVRVETMDMAEGAAMFKQNNGSIKIGDGFISDFLVIDSPLGGGALKISLPVKEKPSTAIKIAHSKDNFASFQEVSDVTVSSGMARFETKENGVFVARSTDESLSVIAIAVSVTVVFILLVLVIGTAIYCRIHPSAAESVRSKFNNFKRSNKPLV